MFFGFCITLSPCHVVTFQSVLRFRYGYSKLKKVHDVKQLLILDIYLLVIFTRYYDSSPPLWKVVANSMSSCW